MKIPNVKLQIARVKILHFSFLILPIAFLAFTGCATYQVAGDIEQGRPQLIYGDPKVALAHFRRAAELDPDYRYNFSILSEGVWSYVGRAYYETGNMPEARNALEKDLSRYSDDHLARLYLGLVRVKDGDEKQGLQDMQAGLKSLHDWLDYIHQYNQEGFLWDPGSDLRSEIRSELVMIDTKGTPLAELISRAGDLGKRFEREIDLVRRDRYRFDNEDSESH